MKKEDVRRRVVEILVDVLCICEDAAIPEATLNSLGADSLDVIQITMHIREQIVAVDEDKLYQCETVQQVLDLVEKAHGDANI